ncbi:replication initiation protein [Azonexus sp. R2A61]|uniref:replication initiation protein n=1 Tax=Azonexus sp. R2A61 TaxID=2744443 RepID=UPI001F24CEEC|nr:replication initiation protein [Azonexus sp. R2A61]
MQVDNTLTRFYNHLSTVDKLQCANKFDDGISLLPLNYAKHKKNIQVHPFKKQYIALDIDYPITRFEIVKMGFKLPTIFIQNPKNGHAHILYELTCPVSFQPNSRKAPQKLFKEVSKVLGEEMGADENYAGHFIKNPLNKAWTVHTNDVTYELKDFLADSESLNKDYSKAVSSKNIEIGRNQTIFDTIRKIAYQSVLFATCPKEFKEQVLNDCKTLNQSFDNPLTGKEVKQIATSISKWVWNKKASIIANDKQSKKNIGIMGFGPNALQGAIPVNADEVKTRQSAGAKYTANIKSSATLKTLQKAFKELSNAVYTPTQKELAEHTKLGIATIKRHWKSII